MNKRDQNITLAMLVGMMSDRGLEAGTPAAIEASEKLGQIELVNSTKLPADMGRRNRPIFEAMGIVFGAPVDDIFLEAKLPDGWSKRSTDHDMWSEVLDEKGRKRIAVFYKAAFYDRNAYMRPVCRFNRGRQYDPKTHESVAITVTDHDGTVLYSLPLPAKSKGYTIEYSNACEKVDEQIQTWLEANKPNYVDPLAYWNED